MFATEDSFVQLQEFLLFFARKTPQKEAAILIRDAYRQSFWYANGGGSMHHALFKALGHVWLQWARISLKELLAMLRSLKGDKSVLQMDIMVSAARALNSLLFLVDSCPHDLESINRGAIELQRCVQALGVDV